jgi:hypothetical protein
VDGDRQDGSPWERYLKTINALPRMLKIKELG